MKAIPPAGLVQDEGSTRRDLVAAMGCFVLGMAISIIPWLFRHRFYFHDDMQHQHMPIFVHIGRLLRAGEVPILTLATFTSGNLLGEYQFAVLNPVSLAVYAVLPSIPSLETGALFMACFFYGVLASGTFVLARAYGVAPLGAAVAATVMACNNLISYWFAASWFPVFVSLAWFVWAWAFLARAGRSRLDWVLAVVFCYLTIASGWPQTTIMLGVVCLLVAFETWRSSGLFRGGLVVAALAAATLIAATVLLGLASVTEVAARYRGVMNNNVFVPNLRDLLALSSPFHRGWMSWGGYKLTGTPMFVLAWFVVPLLPLIRWKEVDWRRPELVTLLAIAGLCLFATQGPEEFFMVRWPFRYVPYFHIAVIVLFLALASRAGFAPLTIGRLCLVALLVLVSCLSSFQADPGGWPIHLAGLLACAAAVGIFLAIPTRLPQLRIAWFGLAALAMFTATHAHYRLNTDVPDWGLPETVQADLPANVAPRAYTMFRGWLGNAGDVGRLGEYQTGMMPRVQEAATINGYTPLGHRAGSEFLCMNMFGETCPEGIERLFGRDPATGAQYLDLLRVDRLIAMRGPHLDFLRPLIDRSWRLEWVGQRTYRYVRQLPNAALPGMAAWVSPGATLASAGETRPTREAVRISRPADRPTTIVFARLWWPGYQAEFNGEALPVRAHRGFLVGVDVPAGAADGVLTLRYRPPHLGAGMAGLAGGLAIVIAVLVAWPRRSRNGNGQPAEEQRAAHDAA